MNKYYVYYNNRSKRTKNHYGDNWLPHSAATDTNEEQVTGQEKETMAWGWQGSGAQDATCFKPRYVFFIFNSFFLY